jgi:hypothetical protein
MAMKPPLAMFRRFRPRFSLRWLFVFIALVAVFCGYHINWIRQRHALIARNQARMQAMDSNHDDGSYYSGHQVSWFVSPPGRGGLEKHNWNCLWMFGEPDVGPILGGNKIRILQLTFELKPNQQIEEMQKELNSTDFNSKIDALMQSYHDDEIDEALRLFPEAGISVTVNYFERLK